MSKPSILTLAIAVIIGGGVPTALLSAGSVRAADEIPLKVISQPIVIDGTAKDAPVANVDGDTYIGLRYLNEQLGLDTAWDPDKQIVTVNGRGRTLQMDLKEEMYVFNQQRIYGLPAILQDGSTYVPLRLLLERMGYGISYDAASQRIGIETIKENELTFGTTTIAKVDSSITVNYPQLNGFANKAIQQKINDFLKKEVEANVAAAAKELSDALKDQSEIKADNPDLMVSPVSYEGNYTVSYNEQGKLSLYMDYYLYTGGAHGMDLRTPYTFDLATGDLLTLQDVAGNKPDYVSIINDSIQKQIAMERVPLLETFKTIEPDRHFFLKHNEVVIYFEPYEYTAYADGMPEFEIPFSAFK
ncbi:Anti-sigma-V factor RsiV [compost metagenome]